MFVIGEAVIDDDVARSAFCCDLQKCKGACCTLEGGRGAPLEDHEVLEIEKAFPLAKQYLGEKSLRFIGQQGMYEGRSGDFATTCIDRRECAFAYFNDGIAYCSFERAFEAGLTDWRKPLSCHLFPIRIREFGRDYLRYEQIDECQPARISGEMKQVSLHSFLKEPLSRKYGEQWYEQFVRYCESKGTRGKE